MTALFHFEEKIHRKNLSRDETIPLLFLRLLSQMLEHLGFPAEPYLKHRHVCEVIFTVKKWQFVPGAPHVPLRDPVEDQPADDHLIEDQPADDHLVEDQPPPAIPSGEP